MINLDHAKLTPEMRRLRIQAQDAFDADARREFLELTVQAIRAAPDPWSYGRYYLFLQYVGGLEAQFQEVLDPVEDKKVFLSFVNAPDEPVLFRIEAASALVMLFGTDDRDGMANYFRLILELAEQVDPQDMNRSVVTPIKLHCSVRREIQEHVENAKLNLRTIENPFAIQSDPAYLQALASRKDQMPIVFRPEGQQFPLELESRLQVGGKACDGCGKTLQKLGVARLDCCVRCKMAYYCSRECQRKQWKAGHKAACRKPNDIRAGDTMVLRGLVARSDLNESVVLVKHRNAAAEGRWIVTLYGTEQKELSIASDKLFHIRPAK